MMAQLRIREREKELVNVVASYLYGDMGYEVDEDNPIDLSDATHPEEKKLYRQASDIIDIILFRLEE